MTNGKGITEVSINTIINTIVNLDILQSEPGFHNNLDDKTVENSLSELKKQSEVYKLHNILIRGLDDTNQKLFKDFLSNPDISKSILESHKLGNWGDSQVVKAGLQEITLSILNIITPSRNAIETKAKTKHALDSIDLTLMTLKNGKMITEDEEKEIIKDKNLLQKFYIAGNTDLMKETLAKLASIIGNIMN